MVHPQVERNRRRRHGTAVKLSSPNQATPGPRVPTPPLLEPSMADGPSRSALSSGSRLLDAETGRLQPLGGFVTRFRESASSHAPCVAVRGRVTSRHAQGLAFLIVGPLPDGSERAPGDPAEHSTYPDAREAQGDAVDPDADASGERDVVFGLNPALDSPLARP